jgi:aspartyl-tRNA(Asn)/glutamyl-tRNA(Gln) amidotransferase subunit A
LQEAKHLWELGAANAAHFYAKGIATPLAILDSVLQRLDDVNPMLNAIATLDLEGARSAATASTQRHQQGEALGPLDGVILTVKDNIAVANLPCMWGTEMFRNFVPSQDEIPVARLRKAGVVILGKTAVSEFSNGRGIVSTPLFGTTRNPWRPDLTTGSSSGGAAAAVAAGIGSAAIATDGGGSIRIPASNCGLFGLKPSAGQVARAHGLPIIMNGQEVVGPIARSASDLDLIMRVIAGPHEEDAASWPMPYWPGGALSEDGIPRRILLVTQVAGKRAEKIIEDACLRAAQNLKSLGHTVESGEMPYDHQDIVTSRLVTKAGMAWLLRDKDWRGRTDDFYASAVEAGSRLSAADYVEATAAARRVQVNVGRLFQKYDFIITPATTALPGPADIPVQSDYTIFTAFANVAGVPAVSLPACLTPERIPIGFQLTGRFGSDRELLNIAHNYEKHFDAMDFTRIGIISM